MFFSRATTNKEITSIDESTGSQSIFYVHEYIKSVSPLFGPNFTSRPSLAKIEISDLDSFNAWLNSQRPSSRKKSKENGFDFSFGLLYRDACTLKLYKNHIFSDTDVYAVEIKPKQGWHIASLSDSLLKLYGVEESVRHMCRFCAMQYVKIQTGKAVSISKYCPMDLFSGYLFIFLDFWLTKTNLWHCFFLHSDLKRMKIALQCLIDSPQNNFRVFRNGQLVYSDGNRIDDLEAILCPFFSRYSEYVH